MGQRSGRVRIALCLMFALVTARVGAAPVPGTGAAAANVVQVVPPRSAEDEQRALLKLVNLTRSQSGLPALAWDEKLAAAAREHAETMAEQGTLSHQFAGEAALLERLTAHRVRLDRASENVVYDVTVEGAHENFMSSTPHRANLLDPGFDSIGIGVVEAGGLLYIVEDFSHRVADVSDEQAARIVADSFDVQRRKARAGNLSLIYDQRLQQIAQAMAESETPNGAPGLALPGARFAASYATLDPAKIPPAVAHLTALHGVTHIGVGVHYARTPKYPAGLYWVTVVLFHTPEVKSAQMR